MGDPRSGKSHRTEESTACSVEEAQLHGGDEVAIGPIIYRVEVEATAPPRDRWSAKRPAKPVQPKPPSLPDLPNDTGDAPHPPGSLSPPATAGGRTQPKRVSPRPSPMRTVRWPSPATRLVYSPARHSIRRKLLIARGRNAPENNGLGRGLSSLRTPSTRPAPGGNWAARTANTTPSRNTRRVVQGHPRRRFSMHHRFRSALGLMILLAAGRRRGLGTISTAATAATAAGAAGAAVVPPHWRLRPRSSATCCWGAGMYNLDTAQVCASINADTIMRWNEFPFLGSARGQQSREYLRRVRMLQCRDAKSRRDRSRRGSARIPKTATSRTATP